MQVMTRGYAASRFGQVHYAVGGSGPPVVLIPPSKRSARVYADLAVALVAHFRVVCPDTLGFGNSDPLPSGATVADLAEGTLACLDSLGMGHAHFFGLHTGNKIAAAIAAQAPQRVDKLVLAGHTHSLIPNQARRNAVIGELVKTFLAVDVVTDEAERARQAWETLQRRVADAWWDGSLFGAAGTLAQVRLAKRVVVDYLQSSDSTVGLYEANFRYDLEADLRQIKAPTLILEIATPDEDRDFGRQAEHVSRLIPGSTVATLHEAAGHTHTLEGRSDELAAILTTFFGHEP
jgi:pimeloyl-ACP methyl ester carboxylesterase